MYNLLKSKDFISILILITLFTIGFICTFGQHGTLFTDCGREVFLPTVAFDKEHIMYRDIFNLYPVFSYQFNGFLYKIFGENFNVLYFAGYINTLIIIYAFYGISRFFLNIKLAFSLGIFLIFYSIFGIINPYMDFIFPYSYAYIYALSMFLVSLFCFLKFSKTNSSKYLLAASLFLGLSTACKFEFALTFLVYIFSIIILKIKLPLKITFLSLFWVLIPSVLSYGYLLIQGFNLPDLINYIDFGQKFFNTESYKEFTKVYPLSIPICFVFFIITFSGFIPLFLYLKKDINYNIKNIFSICTFIILGLVPVYYFFNKQIYLFYWICFTSFLICLYLIYLFKKNFSRTDFLFFIVVISFLLSALKYNFCLSKASYGNYIIPLFVMVHVIFLVNYCKNIFKKYDIINFITITLISFSLLNTAICLNMPIYKNRTYRVETNKGMIYESETTGKAIYNLIKYIKENTSEKDTILVLQEGVAINFLTDRPTDLMLYHLRNNHIEALGENYIINRLTKNMPKYIVTIDTKHLTPNILNFIQQNYSNTVKFNNMAVKKRNTD